MSLSALDGSVIAQDLLIPGIKATVHFSAKASALTYVVDAAQTYGATADEQVAIYKRATNHPRFAELEAIYRHAKGWPSDEVPAERAGEIAVTIAFDLLEELKEVTQN